MKLISHLTQRLTDRFHDGEHLRLAPSMRRRKRTSRPFAESLETRSLLSVGLDPSFGFGGLANLNLAGTATSQPSFSTDSIALQNGQIVSAGSESDYLSATAVVAVARLTTGGAFDTSFASTGIETIPNNVVAGFTLNSDPAGVRIAVQSNRQLLVLTTATAGTTTGFAVIRLNANGGLDASFGNHSGIELFSFGPDWTVGEASGLVIGSDGTIVMAGTVTSTSLVNVQFGIARLNANGQLDTSFNAGGTTPGTQELSFGATEDASPVAVAVNSSNNIVVVGNVTPLSARPSHVSNIGLALLDSHGNGQADTLPGFNGNNDDTATALTLQGSQIVIAGYSVATFAPSVLLNDVDSLFVSRLNPDATFDSTFNGTGKFTLPLDITGIASTSLANAIAVLPDGSLLVGGESGPTYSYPSSGLLLNLNPNGTLNTSYGTNGMAILPSYVSNGPLLVQNDGKIVFISSDGIGRTTPPAPLVFPSPVLITKGTGSKTKVSGVTIFFNTSVNPGMASNIKIYRVHIGTKGRRNIKLRNATYDGANNSVSLQFRKPAKLNKKGYRIIFMASTGIVGSGSQLLNGGSAFAIYVPPTATS